jgi:hypothetical protein
VGLLIAVLPRTTRAQTGTANPHGELKTPCAQCHLPDAWRPTKISPEFKHAPGRFALEGAHARASCASCHKRLDFTGVSSNCVSCHRDAHQGELGANCAKCHSSRSFLDMAPMRQTHQVTAFPLKGAHAAADCRSCHTPRAPGQQAFVNLPSTCQTCHLAAYQKTTNPPHVAGGFSRDCSTCHSTTGWQGKAFDHSITRFVLTGAHKTLNCASCHSDGVYAAKPTTCVSCHQTAYQATTNPNHAAANFSTDCATCHTTTAWTGNFVAHDASFFPIYSGAHAGKWASCATCHTNATNYTVFDCLSCHNKGTTDNQHRGRAGYVYASPNCYSCHARGRA